MKIKILLTLLSFSVQLVLPMNNAVLPMEATRALTSTPDDYVAQRETHQKFVDLTEKESFEQQIARLSNLHAMGYIDTYPLWKNLSGENNTTTTPENASSVLQTIPISDQIAASRGEMKRCNHKLFNALQTYDGKDNKKKDIISKFSHVSKIYNDIDKHFYDTPLSIAFEQNNQNSALLLLENNPSQATLTPLLLSSQPLLNEAIQKGWTNVALKLLNNIADLSDKKELLFEAINSEENNDKLIQSLIEKGADINEIRESGKDTPLIHALKNENTNIALTLIKNPKINVNLSNFQGDTALHLAASMKDTQVLTELLKKPDIQLDKKNTLDETPLYIAIEKSNEKAVQLLLLCDHNKKQIDINQTYKTALTPLEHALDKGNLKIFNLLIDRQDLKINALLNTGNTILHTAVGLDKQEIIELLLKHQDLKINTLNKNGKTPLDIISRDSIGEPVTNSKKAIDKLLRGAGAVNSSNLQIPPKPGTIKHAQIPVASSQSPRQQKNNLTTTSNQENSTSNQQPLRSPQSAWQTVSKYVAAFSIVSCILYLSYKTLINNYKFSL